MAKISRMTVEKYAKKLGIQVYREFDPAKLVPEERIRAYCEENKCGSYGRNYTCPPHAGTLDEMKDRLKQFRRGILLQYYKDVDIKNNLKEALRSKNEFHAKVLNTEKFMNKQGITRTWGLIGGNCGICDTCRINDNKPCRHPDKARMSLEAIGIDVVGLLDNLGLDSEFRGDRITWTGCVLY